MSLQKIDRRRSSPRFQRTNLPFQMRLFALILALTLLVVCDGVLGIGRTQSVAVSGHLQCNGVPSANVKVKLYDREVLIDTKLDEGRTDKNGYFRLAGFKTEISSIDPKVNIYHRCNYKGPCYKKLPIKIPKDYITSGQTPKKTYDIGTLNLANKFPGVETDCIN
ncbi:unnamed protein product [Heligmosomoides polygyrus]|uniref:Transthyretin-like family protein n=1 Tax=Heligmosomoides polygyrus TaxID=6339 RepID=A0A183GUL4_HELPZ|nr:unnamed protein product [Heligmosomoides polygyrus]